LKEEWSCRRMIVKEKTDVRQLLADVACPQSGSVKRYCAVPEARGRRRTAGDLRNAEG
jgi:hypothetical protein